LTGRRGAKFAVDEIRDPLHGPRVYRGVRIVGARRRAPYGYFLRV
jgi:hypothetical protein